MEIFDASCMIGNWPFRKLYKNTIKDLIEVHKDNNITGGCISSLNSIFYNDPFEGDEELHEIIKNSNYQHIMTINPSLPAFDADIERGCKLFSIKGVRIYPGYHSYNLESNGLEDLCSILEEKDIPLIVTLRMEDERLNYIINPTAIKLSEIEKLIQKHQKLKIVLANIRYAELIEIKASINKAENVYFDTTGLKDKLFVAEKLLPNFPADKILFGSLHPLYCLKSILLLIQKAQIADEIKEKILCKNAKQLFKPAFK